MPILYSDAESVKEYADNMVANYHPHLATARMKYIFREKAAMSGGLPKPGTVRRITGALEHLLELDFLVEVGLDLWNTLSEQARRGLVDHLLTHCQGVEDEQTGKMVWKLRQPDVKEFSEVLQRNGSWHEGLSNFVSVAQGLTADQILSPPLVRQAEGDATEDVDGAGTLAMGWDTKYRPKTFKDVLGQEATIKILKARLSRGTAFDTSYLFGGGSGMGKTTLGRIYARAMLCEHLNKEDPEPCNACDNCIASLTDQPGPLIEIDAGSGGTIDAVRSIVESVSYPPMTAPLWVYVIDETHRMSRAGQDALLKPIEEKRLIALFCTTEPEEIRPAIRGRCESHLIRRVPPDLIVERMTWVLGQEGVSYEPEAVKLVVQAHQGHVRDILNTLETLSQVGGVTLALAEEYLDEGLRRKLYSLLPTLANIGVTLPAIEAILVTHSPEEVLEGLADASMAVYQWTLGLSFGLADAEKKQVQDLAGLMPAEVWLGLARHFSKGTASTRAALYAEILSAFFVPVSAPAQGMAPPPMLANPVAQAVITPPLGAGNGLYDIAPPVKTKKPEESWRLAGASSPAKSIADSNGAKKAINIEDRERGEILTPSQWRANFLVYLSRKHPPVGGIGTNPEGSG